MKFLHKTWGHIEGKAGELLKFEDPKSGFEVHLTNLGATLVRVKVPDRMGEVNDIIYGQNSPDAYIKQRGYFGSVVGRVANRIGNACFDLDGEHYELYVNNANKHSLHGGERGLSYRFWDIIDSRTKINDEFAKVSMQYESPDGEEGFPGGVTIRVIYTIKPMEIGWEFFAFTNKSTIINITNHAYWNLEKLNQPIDNQELQLNSSRYNPADSDCLPTGEIANVDGLGIDFRKNKKFSEVFQTFGDVDHNFLLDDYQTKGDRNNLTKVGTLYSQISGRKMHVWTTEPCMQVYTGNFMENLQAFGRPLVKHSAVCLETQRMPNAINIPEYRDSVILNPKEQYYQQTIHKFEVSD